MKVSRESLLLYAVTDRSWLNGRTLRSQVEEALDGGATFLQLREKNLDDAHFLEEARELQALCRERGVPFIVNDNVDVALAMGADGIHVGQHDMEAGDVRRLLGPDRILGVSAQTAICEAVTIPVVAIGGISLSNVKKLAGSGICGIAVISAIFAQKDIRLAAEQLRKETEEMLEKKR